MDSRPQTFRETQQPPRREFRWRRPMPVNGLPVGPAERHHQTDEDQRKSGESFLAGHKINQTSMRGLLARARGGLPALPTPKVISGYCIATCDTGWLGL